MEEEQKLVTRHSTGENIMVNGRTGIAGRWSRRVDDLVAHASLASFSSVQKWRFISSKLSNFGLQVTLIGAWNFWQSQSRNSGQSFNDGIVPFVLRTSATLVHDEHWKVRWKAVLRNIKSH